VRVKIIRFVFDTTSKRVKATLTRNLLRPANPRRRRVGGEKKGAQQPPPQQQQIDAHTNTTHGTTGCEEDNEQKPAFGTTRRQGTRVKENV